MLEATSGQVTIDGLNNGVHIEEVRQNLGFCPQYGETIDADARETTLVSLD
jgi:ABC-type multidrug transport system ATPase subunit